MELSLENLSICSPLEFYTEKVKRMVELFSNLLVSADGNDETPQHAHEEEMTSRKISAHEQRQMKFTYVNRVVCFMLEQFFFLRKENIF